MTHADDTGLSVYARHAEALRAVLLLRAHPVGVRVVASGDDRLPLGLPRPSAPLHYCAAVMRATAGESFTLGLDDVSCDTAPRTLGLEPGFHDDDFIESYVTGGLYADRLRADLMLAGVTVLYGISALEVAPLHAFHDAAPPDVIVLATTPYAAMRVVQAAAYRGHRVRNEPIGMHGICAECTAGPIATGEVTVSLLCSGTRHVAGWSESELAVGLPTMLLADIVDGLRDSVGRFETDSRKSAIGRCYPGDGCGGQAPCREALRPGTSYFSTG